jgi:hypothetical protein
VIAGLRSGPGGDSWLKTTGSNSSHEDFTRGRLAASMAIVRRIRRSSVPGRTSVDRSARGLASFGFRLAEGETNLSARKAEASVRKAASPATIGKSDEYFPAVRYLLIFCGDADFEINI